MASAVNESDFLDLHTSIEESPKEAEEFNLCGRSVTVGFEEEVNFAEAREELEEFFHDLVNSFASGKERASSLEIDGRPTRKFVQLITDVHGILKDFSSQVDKASEEDIAALLPLASKVQASIFLNLIGGEDVLENAIDEILDDIAEQISEAIRKAIEESLENTEDKVIV